MKRILAVSILGILLFSSLGALNANAGTQPTTVRQTDYTHTVMVEVATATWCPSCPASNAAWHSIYAEGTYDFQYTEMVIDMNAEADTHLSNDYNLYWVPTSYFDGGENTYPGTSIPTFHSYLDISGARVVPNISATLAVDWLGNAQISVDLSIQNSDATDYTGTLRVYMLEKVSSMWKDYNNNWYNHAFIGFAFNEPVTIAANSVYSDQTTWTSPYPNIQQDNIQVILAVFGDEVHQGYSDPDHEGDPAGAPFDAYYVDETVMAEPGSGGAPLKPTTPTGPTDGRTHTIYNYTSSSVNPSGNDLYYLFDWGDGTTSDWIGPYPSGTSVTVGHAWSFGGTFNVKVKAKEVQESPWSDNLTVQMIGSTLSIENVTGGLFRIKADIVNTGDETLSDIHCRITLHSGVWMGDLTNTTIDSITGFAKQTVQSGLIFGLGTTYIKIEAWIDDGASAQVQKEGKLFLFFIKIK